MQKQMEEQQEQLQSMEFEASAGGGAVTVAVSGKKLVTKVVIDPDCVDPDDVEMLQDLVMAAVNEAMRQIDEMSSSEMSKITGGLNIPGLV